MDRIEKHRKQLIFRSRHRGTKEADLLLGGFADQELARMKPEELELYEAILTIPDPVLTAWMTGQRPCPEEESNSVMASLLDYCKARRGNL